MILTSLVQHFTAFLFKYCKLNIFRIWTVGQTKQNITFDSILSQEIPCFPIIRHWSSLFLNKNLWNIFLNLQTYKIKRLCLNAVLKPSPHYQELHLGDKMLNYCVIYNCRR